MALRQIKFMRVEEMGIRIENVEISEFWKRLERVNTYFRYS